VTPVNSDRCPVCGHPTSGSGDDPLGELARHLVDQAARSEGQHVMWLNRNVTKRRVEATELSRLLAAGPTGTPGEDRIRR
jgi:hypothetical protein